MRVVLFGGSGMVGQGVLRECLLDPRVTDILSIGRSPLAQTAPTLRHRQHDNFLDFEPLAESLKDFDACFFCLGVSSLGLNEAAYQRISLGYTLAAAHVLARVSPGLCFVYVSGEGTDSTERGRSMWARVKGRTENALQALPFRAVYLFRPGFIQSMHGARSKTPLYRLLYRLTAPLFPVIRALARSHSTTTEEVGQAMLEVARHGAPQAIINNLEIARLAAAARADSTDRSRRSKESEVR